MYMVGVAIGDCSLVTIGDAIQVIVAIGLLVGGQRGSRGSVHTMIATCWGPRVACPDQATERVITEGLTLGERATADGGYSSGCAQDVADVVIGEGLAPEGHAVPRGTAGERAIDTIIAECCRKNRGGRGTGLGTRTNHGHAIDHNKTGIVRMPHQE